MIEKLRAFIENSNKEIQKKLLTEINVESSENDILVQSFLTKDFKEKIKEQLETIYRYIGRCGYKDNVGSRKSIQNNGGVLENEVLDEYGKELQRFWITLS